jgi:hypothetical protein
MHGMEIVKKKKKRIFVLHNRQGDASEGAGSSVKPFVSTQDMCQPT